MRRAKALLRDEQEAAEVLGDVFVELVRREGRLEVEAPAAFLYRTATNLSLNRIRSRKRRPADADSDLVERIATAPEAEDVSILRDLIDRLFGREPPSTRVIAVLHLVDGLTLPEVAEIVGLSESGVRKRLRTFRAQLPGWDGGVA